MAPSDHPLAAGGPVGIRQLAEHELLLTPPGTSIRVVLDEAAEAEGVRLQAKAELDGLRLIASLCFEGFGAGVLPATAIPRWLTTGDWTVVPLPDLPRRCVALACRKRALASAPSRAVQEVIRDGGRRSGGGASGGASHGVEHRHPRREEDGDARHHHDHRRPHRSAR